jgi:hypothetical protein
MPYYINDELVTLSQESFVQDGRHYVPLMEITEKLGGNVGWDAASQTLRVNMGTKTANVQVNNPYVTVDGQQSQLAAPPIENNNTVFVPWDFFRTLGLKANMEGEKLYIHH